MNFITINNNDIIEYINKFGSQRIGLYFSFLLHFLILLLVVGLPNFFTPPPINLPNIIPIEIVNVSELTSITEEVEEKKEITIDKKISNNKVFNKSDVQEIQKKVFNKSDVQEVQKIDTKDNSKPEIKNTKKIILPEEKVIVNKKIEPNIELKKEKIKIKQEIIESLPTKKIKPKIKPVLQNAESKFTESEDVVVKPKLKTKPDPNFSIASMLKDLRNETSSKVDNDNKEKKLVEDELSQKNEKNNENSELSISEIDLLIQQLSSCWSAPAGIVIEKGMMVKISAKIKPNKKILENSVRIIDTNVSKSNPFYGPITESAMRTLMNPECIPLKLPADKYNLWKNLTITFDHSIMKGY